MSVALRVGFNPHQPACPGKVVFGKHFQDAAYELTSTQKSWALGDEPGGFRWHK
jgi:hypothetical protein